MWNGKLVMARHVKKTRNSREGKVLKSKNDKEIKENINQEGTILEN